MGGGAKVRAPRALRRAAGREVSAVLGAVVADRVLARADTAYGPLVAEIPDANRGARHLLRIGAYSIALFRSLTDEQIEAEPATGLVAEAVFVAIRPGRDALNRLGRLRHHDRLRAARWSSDLARRFYYAEPGWRMQEVAVDDGFGMDITRCVVAEYFDQVGEVELCQRVICHQDVRSAERHGISLVRLGTLSGGAERCDFRYHVGSDTAAAGTGRRTMREVSDTVHIDAPPERVWEWLSSLAEHYTDWHPDHVSAHWEHGPPNEVGSILVAVEYLGGRREALRFEMTEIDPPHRFSYRILGLHGLLLPGGAFTITPDDDGSSFTAVVRCRLGPLTERLLRRRVAALETHMRQEGGNLKRILESGP